MDPIILRHSVFVMPGGRKKTAAVDVIITRRVLVVGFTRQGRRTLFLSFVLIKFLDSQWSR